MSQLKTGSLLGVGGKKILIWGAAVVVVLVAGVVLYFGKLQNPSGDDFKASQFTAVYLSTGDIYFGKMDWFPRPRMTNVWFLQRTVDKQNQPQFGLAPFKGVFWTPVDEINLNSKDIVFWTKIKDGSELAKALANPQSIPNAQAQQPPAGAPAAPSGGAPSL